MNADLVQKAQHGDQKAFGLLARACGDRLFGIANRIIRDLDRSEDAVQQALVTAWRELPRLRDPERFDAWIDRVLVHACYVEARRLRQWNSNIRILHIDGPLAPDDTGAVADRDELERGFRRLPPDQRAILVLRHYLGLQPAEIAVTLGIPDGTARSRLHYAHRALRAALDAAERPIAVGEEPRR
ncbi:MAG: sigma-70 family RNA polymerase sigma factor [Chloroflexi bacterium]|nr:sigma-70 family RNA polymerase sigma factor [Chloroflexota bacterium]